MSVFFRLCECESLCACVCVCLKILLNRCVLSRCRSLVYVCIFVHISDVSCFCAILR